jgi:DNA-directed RNA polymerase
MSNESNTQANPISEAYNETMKQDGRRKFNEKYQQAENVTEQAPEYSQLKQVLDLVADGLSKDIEEARRGKGRRPTWLNDLMHLDPRQLALIGLQTCYNAVLKDSTLSSVTQEIGSLIDRECLALELLHSDDEEANKNNRRIVKMVSEAHTSAHIRLKALRNIATKNGTKSVYFGIEEKKGDRKMHMKRRTSNAAPVLSAIFQYCHVFQKDTQYTTPKNSFTRLSFTDEAMRQIERSKEYLQWSQPLLKPIPMDTPNPWQGFHTGAYKDWRLAECVKLVRGASAKQIEAIEHSFKGETPEHFRALNALQETRLCINEEMLEVVEWCWETRQSFGKFPKRDTPEFPRLPKDHMTMDQELKKAIKEDQREWRNTDRRVKGAEAVMKQDLQIANELAVHDWFTIPWACDFRGRFNMVPSFNYHRDDHIKSLFQFQRGRVVEGQNIRWLKIHIANCSGFEKIDKAPLDERVAWFDKNEGVLLDMAKDYKNSLGQWSGADKPFQMLAAIFEYARYLEEGDDFVGFIPISLDGTNSGVQHYSMLTLGKDEGRLCNLVPQDDMADLYQTVADKVIYRLEIDLSDPSAFGKNDITKAELARIWLDYGVSRSLCKRCSMTFSYSSKVAGMTGQYMEDVMKPLQRSVSYGELEKHPIARTNKERKVAARYLAGHSYDSIVETLPKAAEAMKWIQSCTNVLSKQNKLVNWTSPSGFRVFHNYLKRDRVETKIFLFDSAVGQRTRSKVSLSLDTGKVDVRKNTASVAANLIHSLDASGMAKTIVKLLDAGATNDFFMIHDSFAISGDVDDLYHGVREAHIEMYEAENLLLKWQEELRQQLDHPYDFEKAEVDPIPQMGNLDLHGIRDSQFCFS